MTRITTMSTSKSLVTKKPSWRKGKRATAVRVWRPLAMRFPIVCDIFAYRAELPFSPTVLWLYTPNGGTPSNINVIYTSLKCTFIRQQCMSLTIRSLHIHSFSRCCRPDLRNHRKFEKIRTYSSSLHSRSSTLVQTKLTHFLLAVNSSYECKKHSLSHQ